MTIPLRRKANPLFGEPSLASANNASACWIRGVISPLDQKGSTGWLADLYGGTQTGDDWARVNIPVDEIFVPDFNRAQWTWYQTNTETMGLGIVIWVHDPNDFDKRAEITQLGGHADLEKTSGWNAHEFSSTTGGMFFYGEGTTGTGLTAGTQYTWSQFQADVLFKNWTIYRITFDWGWEASGTFESAYLADVKLNGVAVPLKPDKGGSGRIATRFYTLSDTFAYTLAPKTPFRLLNVNVEIDTAGTTSESFTITKDSGIDDAYDVLLYTVNILTASLTDLNLAFGRGYEYMAVDEIDFAWPNTEDREVGLTVTYQTVF